MVLPVSDALFRGDHCDPELIRGLEVRLINLWPAVTTLIMEGWAIRMANGYSGRANSASAIWAGAELTPELLHLMEALFTQAGLEPCVRVTPVAKRGTLEMVLARGYRVKDHTLVMLAPIGAHQESAVAVHLEPKPSPAWLTGVSALQEAAKSNTAHLEAIVGCIQLPATFATVFDGGAPVGFGMAAVDRGFAELGSIILAPAARGRGLGKALVQMLLNWAAEAGAEQAFLQVTQDNSAARGLYESLGFATICGYNTMIKDTP
jgi:N-acetylglutamate synthase